MPKTFTNVLEANAHIAAQETQLAELTTKNNELAAQVAPLTEAAKTKDASIASLTARAEAAEKERDSEKAKVTALTNAQAEQEKDFNNRVEQAAATKAVQILASQGRQPVKTENKQPGDASNAFEKWQAATGVEKTRLWRKHKTEIISLSKVAA